MDKFRTVDGYSIGSRRLHWIIALLVLALLSVSFFLSDLSDTIKPTAYMMHKSVGLTILLLMIVRLVWIIRTGKPGLPQSVPIWQQYLAHGVHWALYVMLFAMPLSGWVMSIAGNRVPIYFGLFPVPIPGILPNPALDNLMDLTHKTIAWILIGLVCLHVAGACKHYFINKDKVLQRMLTIVK